MKKLISLSVLGFLIFAIVRSPVSFADLTQSSRPVYILGVVAFCLLNYGVSFKRFVTSFKILKFRIPAWALYPAFFAGQIGALSIGGPFAQGFARQAMLSRTGISPSVAAFLGLAERAIALLSLLALATTAALFYFPEAASQFDVQVQGISAFLYAVALALVVVGFVAVAPVRVKTSWRRTFKTVSLAGTLQSILLSFASHLAMLGAFSCALLTWGGQIGMAEIAALCIVMFISALPISFSGWGVREAAAAFMLAQLGKPEAVGVAVGVTVGLCSLLPLLASSAYEFVRNTARPPPLLQRKRVAMAHLDRSIVLGMAGVIACLIFFQVRIAAGSHLTNVNGADLLATVALIIAGTELYVRRADVDADQWKTWLGPLALLTSLIAIAALSSVWNGGGTWGLVNRGLGWLLILSYAMIGLTVRLVGRSQDVAAVLLSIVFANALVALIQIAANLYSIAGRDDLGTWFVGWHALTLDANAYCLQCCLSLIAWHVVRDQGSALPRGAIARGLFAFVPLILSSGVLLTRSRVGVVLLLVVSAASLLLPRVRRRSLASLLAAAVFAPGATAALEFSLRASNRYSGGAVRLADKASDGERWQTIQDGLDLWFQHPIFGSGLGGYVQARLSSGQPPQVIHNIYVWLLAEAGIVGFGLATVAFTAFAVGVFRAYKQQGLTSSVYGAAVTLFVFLTGGLVHDFFYQRTVWLMLGLFAANLILPRPPMTAA